MGFERRFLSMGSAMNTANIWQIEESVASFGFETWQGSFHLNRPQQGLALKAVAVQSSVTIFSVAFPDPHEAFAKDCYSRQGDLVVSYPQRAQRNFSVQLDYRLLDVQPESILVELWLSIQTFLLDTHPAVSVESGLDSDDLAAFNAEGEQVSLGEYPEVAIVRYRDRECGCDIAVMLHPRDQGDTHWSIAREPKRLVAQLGGHFMEKGVIRRMRMRALVARSELTTSTILESYAAFAESPLPLTA